MVDNVIERVGTHLNKSVIKARFPPASEELVSDTEKLLRFEMPPLLRRVYKEVANGWSSRGFRLIGVNGGQNSGLGNLVETYNEIIRGAEYHKKEWKDGLLPFCDWGCNIFSCVDCKDLRYPIVQSEVCETHDTGYTLDDFFEMWIQGRDILGFSSSPRRTAVIINPFTRKKTRVKGLGGNKDQPPS